MLSLYMLILYGITHIKGSHYTDTLAIHHSKTVNLWIKWFLSYREKILEDFWKRSEIELGSYSRRRSSRFSFCRCIGFYVCKLLLIFTLVNSFIENNKEEIGGDGNLMVPFTSSDPEVLLIDKSTELPVSAIRLLPEHGKSNKIQISDSQQMFYDNVLLEFNVKPASTFTELKKI